MIKFKSNNTNSKTWLEKHREKFTFGQKMADKLAKGIGSWKFIIFQTFFVCLWIMLNLIAYFSHWDPYPFILLNLLFSVQAAYAAPIIMMSQNRQAERDRVHAAEDYRTNVEAKKEIEELQIALARIENEKLDGIQKKIEEILKKI